jgi:Mg-chelatase subunit ChlD
MELFGIAIHVYPNEAPNNNTGYFGGVPESTLDKWAGKITKLGWTVVVIDVGRDRIIGINIAIKLCTKLAPLCYD